MTGQTISLTAERMETVKEIKKETGEVASFPVAVVAEEGMPANHFLLQEGARC